MEGVYEGVYPACLPWMVHTGGNPMKHCHISRNEVQEPVAVHYHLISDKVGTVYNCTEYFCLYIRYLLFVHRHPSDVALPDPSVVPSDGYSSEVQVR